MLSNAQLKYLTSLQLKKYRQKYAEFIIEGEKILAEAIEEQALIKAIICTKALSQQWQHLADKVEIWEASDKEMEKISSQSTPSGVLALLSIPPFDELDQTHSVLALDGIRDPGNLGTLIRTADWFGVQEVWCSNDCVDIYNPKTVQASMGSLFRVAIQQLPLADTLATDSRKAYAAVLQGDKVPQIPKNESAILIIGSESHGISPAVLEQTSNRISIPGIGKTESLNAAVAGGILMWEMWGHQRPS